MGTFDGRPPQTAAEHAEYAQQLDAEAAAKWAEQDDGDSKAGFDRLRSEARFLSGRALTHATLANAKANAAALDELAGPADPLLVLEAVPVLRDLHARWLADADRAMSLTPEGGNRYAVAEAVRDTFRACAAQLEAAVSGP